jgi:hypothetical protein
MAQLDLSTNNSRLFLLTDVNAKIFAGTVWACVYANLIGGHVSSIFEKLKITTEFPR